MEEAISSTAEIDPRIGKLARFESFRGEILRVKDEILSIVVDHPEHGPTTYHRPASVVTIE